MKKTSLFRILTNIENPATELFRFKWLGHVLYGYQMTTEYRPTS